MADGGPIQNHSTETDAKFLNIFGKKKDAEGKEGDTPDAGWSQNPVAPNPGCDRDAEEYNMRHTHRGVALLFNHELIPGMTARSGTDKDCKRLAHELTNLRFEVYIHNDLKYQQIMDVIAQVSGADHSDNDCLLVAVMTHGDPGVLHSRDRKYQVREIWEPFAVVPTLVGKPKLFFIQACRGTMVDHGLLVTDSAARSRDVTDAYTTGYFIPSQADIMVAYSTVEGYYSWRNPINGSWFIQALCEELKMNGTKRDLLTLLTFVCRRVALDYQSVVPLNYDMDNKKQVPSITSSLTRLVFFHDRQ